MGITIILLCFLAAAVIVLWDRRKVRKTMEEIEKMLECVCKLNGCSKSAEMIECRYETT